MKRSLIIGVVSFCLLISLAGMSTQAAAQVVADEEKAKIPIAMIKTFFSEGESIQFGAGVIFGTDDSRIYILTANHLLRRFVDGKWEGATKIEVRFHFLPGQPFKAILLVDHDQELDLGLINVSVDQSFPFGKLRFGEISNSATLKRRQELNTIGCPNGTEWGTSADFYHVSEVNTRFFKFVGIVHPGTSGGGVFDKDWRLVGMLTGEGSGEGRAVMIGEIVSYLTNRNYPLGWGSNVRVSLSAPQNDLATTKGRVECSGTYPADLTDDIWVFVAPENVKGTVYPQSDKATKGLPAQKTNKKWRVMCYLGGEPQQYELILYTATPDASQALGTLLRAWSESNKFEGIATESLPVGLVERDRIRVTKTTPTRVE